MTTAVAPSGGLVPGRVDDPGTRLLAAPAAGAGPGLQDHWAVHGPLTPGDRRGPRPQQLLAEIEAAGLTGRGGAGFPTGRKLALAARQRRRPVLLVNAMEGEPASGKDRLLLQRAPHLVLDGAAAAALAVGAAEAVVCLAAEDTPTQRALRHALAERAAARPDPVPILVALPPGRYAAGEESALCDWVAGGRGLPAFRPDKGVPLTIRRLPVLLQNAETLAHVALVARHGADWFRGAGTPDAPGTTLVTLSGALSQPGVVEVELGTPLAAVLRRGGCTAAPQAVLLGGFGGTWIAGAHVDQPYAPGPLGALGATLGAGVIGVVPDGACVISETARIVAYLAGESAGQCGPCVFGLPALADDLARLAGGRADGRLLDRLRARLDAVEGRGACRLPDGAVRLVRTMLDAVPADVRQHARRRPCPSWNHRGLLPVPPPSPGRAGGGRR